jgi:hypothetical protein
MPASVLIIGFGNSRVLGFTILFLQLWLINDTFVLTIRERSALAKISRILKKQKLRLLVPAGQGYIVRKECLLHQRSK